MKLVMLLFNVTPKAFSHQTCLSKYMTTNIGPEFHQTKSWLLRHHDWTSSYIVWEQMCTYQNIDATIVPLVRQSLLQHLWYLTEHFVIPAFLWVCNSWFEGSYGYSSSFVSSNIWACSQDLMRDPWGCFPWACWVFGFHLGDLLYFWCLWISLSLIQSLYIF